MLILDHTALIEIVEKSNSKEGLLGHYLGKIYRNVYNDATEDKKDTVMRNSIECRSKLNSIQEKRDFLVHWEDKRCLWQSTLTQCMHETLKETATRLEKHFNQDFSIENLELSNFFSDLDTICTILRLEIDSLR